MSSRVTNSFEVRGSAAFLAICAAAAMGCSGGSGSSPDAMPGVNCDVPELFLQHCDGGGCHGSEEPAVGLDLTSAGVAERISGQMATQSLGVIAQPGLPEDSVLYDRVQVNPTTGARMPYGKPDPLSDAEITCIRDWISGLLPPQPMKPDAGDCAECMCSIGDSEDCFSGAHALLENAGACQTGTRVCRATPSGSYWGVCEDEVIPQPERCDTPDIDEDCDGAAPACSETWSFALATALTNQAARSVAVDSEDDFYLAGDFAGKIDLGGGTLISDGTLDAVRTEDINNDVFLAKYDKYGNHIWSHRFGDTSTQNSTQVVVDGNDEVVLLGRAFGKIDFGTGLLDAEGTDDIFVVKFRSDGTARWGTILGGISGDRAERIAIDRNNDIWVTGTFTDEAEFGQFSFDSQGIRDAIVFKIDGESGTVRRALSIGGGSTDDQGVKSGDNYGFGVDVYTDSSGGTPEDFVYITGYFSESIQIGSGPTLTSAGGKDIYVAKLDSEGNHVWSRRYGSPLDDVPYDLVVDPSDGSATFTGYFQGEVDFGGGAIASNGSYDIFLAKLDANGDHVFSKGFGDETDQHFFDTFDTNTWSSLDLDQDGNILLGGPLVGTATFGSIPLTSPNGKMDVFLAKFSPSGDHIYSTRYGDGGTQIALDIAATLSGHVLVVGRFYSSTLQFDPATGSIRGIGVSNGVSSGGDGFVARLAVD